MKRNFERKLIKIISIWHVINAILTIFVFGMNIKNNGTQLLRSAYPELGDVSSSLVDNIYIVLSTYGLLLILIGILNIYFSKTLKDNEINKKWQIYLIILLLVSLLTMDFISILGYSIMIAIYNSKNKAIRTSDKNNNQVFI